MTQSLIIITCVLLLLVVLFLLFRVQAVTGVLSGADKDKDNPGNRLMGTMMIGFFIVGLIAFVYYTNKYWDEMILPIASEHGSEIDMVFAITTVFMIAAFLITNFLLMFFAFKYRYRNNHKATFYPHNNRLEMIWTIIPAVVLSILIFTGWKTWANVMDKAPSDAIQVELRAEQFAWQARYPGEDNKFGKIDFRRIDVDNQFGLVCEDPASADDFFGAPDVHIPVGKPVLIKIRSRDVLHSLFIPHLRVKMDAVPGMPTKFWFTATKTTAQMREELGDPEFNFEIACAEVCGRSHFAMRKILTIETEEEYNAWIAKQKPLFEKNPGICGNEPLEETQVETPSMEEEGVETSEVEETDAEGMEDEGMAVDSSGEGEVADEVEEVSVEEDSETESEEAVPAEDADVMEEESEGDNGSSEEEEGQD